MAAPLIVRSAEDLRSATCRRSSVLLHDFTFRDPAEILAELTGRAGMAHAGHDMDDEHVRAWIWPGMDTGAMDHGAMSGDGSQRRQPMTPILANDRTLARSGSGAPSNVAAGCICA